MTPAEQAANSRLIESFASPIPTTSGIGLLDRAYGTSIMRPDNSVQGLSGIGPSGQTIQPYRTPSYTSLQPTQPQPTQPTQTTGGADSLLTQLLKIAQTPGGLNPTQKAELARELGLQQPDYNKQIEEAYNPTMGYLNELEGKIRGNETTDIRDINTRYQTYLDRLPTEKQQLLGDVAQNEMGVNQKLTSAYDQAVRAYNTMKQSGLAKFGAGSSAGQALGELANQEYFRQQGNLANQNILTSAQFAGQKQKINDYITQKSDDLRVQKEDAIKQLNRNTQEKLLAIQSNRAQTESAKANAKLQIIQQAMADARAIEAADRTFKQNLVLTVISQMNQVAGQTFTPQQIIAQIPAMQNIITGQKTTTGDLTQAPLQGGNILASNTNQDQLQGGNILGTNPQDFFSSLNPNQTA